METTREMHRNQIENTMKEWGARLDALKASGDKASAEAKVEMRKQVDELSRLQDLAKKHFDELKASSKEAWKGVQKDVEARWSSLTASVDSIWAKTGN